MDEKNVLLYFLVTEIIDNVCKATVVNCIDQPIYPDRKASINADSRAAMSIRI